MFRNTTEPLDLNLDNAPVILDRGGSSAMNQKTFRYYVSIDWDTNAIGDIAEAAGFEEVYYADIRTLSILSYWTQRFVTVYGR